MDDFLLDDDFGLLQEVASTRDLENAPIYVADPRLALARALVKRLRGRDVSQPAPRTRIGVLHLAPQFLGDETNLAVRLGAEQVSLAQCVLESAPPASRWLGLDAQSLLRRLDALTSEAISPQRPGDCLLVAHADLVLAALSTRERALFWRECFANLPHRLRALVIVLPDTADVLLPPTSEWQQWQNAGRSAVIS